jgi:predicted metalloendopeptidase
VTEAARPIDRSLTDPAVAAADDFFRYVNGGWLDANPVPAEYPAWGAFHELDLHNQEIVHRLLQAAAATPAPEGSPERLAGDYYAAGMDEAAIAAASIEPLRPLLHLVAAAAATADLLAVVAELQRNGIGAFHSLAVFADFEDASAYLAYVGQGGLGLPDRAYYLGDDERSITLRAAYVDHVAEQLGNLGTPAAEARAAAEAILVFEHRLAEVSLPPEQLRDPMLTMNRFAVDALDELMPAGLAAHVRALGVTSPTVCIDHPDFFRGLETALVETPLETLRWYLRWHIVRAYASALPPAFEDASFAFFGRTLGGQQEPKPRWKRVLGAAGADIGEAVAQLYVSEAFPPRAKARCEELVGHLFAAMGRSIRSADWMSEATRAEALTKLAGFGCKIGYPDTWRDYTGLPVGRDRFAANRIAAARFEHERQLGRLGDPVDRAEWEMPAHVVNAYYHPIMNEIVFPAGILQPPFFWADADDAVNYGGIGAVIGHEITHGFDDTGSRFDAAGSLRDWWTEADRTEFERRAEVLVAQFDAFEAAEGAPVNGHLTLGENIADLGGLTIALDALRDAGGADGDGLDGFTPVQRFYLAYATSWRQNTTEAYARLLATVDPHAPARARVNGPLANLPAFAEAFGVPVGSPMARAAEEQARIW